TGLYAVLYVLLNLEQFALVIGSLMLFVALAAVMFATRGIEWSKVSLSHEDDPAPQAQDEGDSAAPA
ncbi:MAG: inner membrane CreD family protein, partial [Pseudomonadota bacterium]